ncbi:LysR family transcriptional regulator [Jannaschia sp. S6380]|uniref:LysR family transcriptional regulator n=1 Tax=Jannaschia sp. S6380 TaxID=2926408 RepID=UPI001FF4934E|nr:LysR family transcriptional regulator [Jannaschia sp. S6380]MCK0166740.1 LysR family transcriptional regulator [Jannaschia sp. S6380]
MQNRDLTTLRMIARTGSFREAAERLNMTQSAVSMQMKALQRSLAASLFDRNTRPPTLTPLGRAVAAAAGDVLAAEARLRDLTGPDAPLAGTFRIGLVASAGPRLLPGFLPLSARALPHARFTFRTGLSETLEQDVARGMLDAAVVTATGVPPGGLRHRGLMRDRLLLAARADLPEDAPFLQFAPSTGIGRLIAAALPEHRAMAERPRVVLDHVEAIRACVAEGVGATILPESDLAGIRGIECTALARSRDLVLVTRIGTKLDAQAAMFAELLTGQRSAASATAAKAASSSRATSSSAGASDA